jgi:hypothetical protein
VSRGETAASTIGDPAQLALFQPDVEDMAPLVEAPPDEARDGTIAERALRFHARNPHVYRFAVRVARYIKARGVRRYSINAVWEIMRFKRLETVGDVYRLNNNHRAFYARLIMARESDLREFFAVRETAHDPDYPTTPART